MINVKKLTVIAIALLIIGGAGSLITFFTMNKHDNQESTTVNGEGITAVQVRLNNGHIDVQQSDDSNIRVELTGEERSSSNLKLHIEETDGTVHIETANSVKSMFQLFSKLNDVRLTVYIPAELPVSVKSNNSSIAMSTNGLDRDIDMKAENGSIHIVTDRQPTNAAFDMRAKNGKIKVFGNREWDNVVGSGEHVIKLRTNNGSITIEEKPE